MILDKHSLVEDDRMVAAAMVWLQDGSAVWKMQEICVILVFVKPVACFVVSSESVLVKEARQRREQEAGEAERKTGSQPGGAEGKPRTNGLTESAMGFLL